MPVTSVAVFDAVTGRTLRKEVSDSEMAKVLAAVDALPPTGPKKERGASKLAELLGLPLTAEETHKSRDWVRRKLRVAVEQKLVDNEAVPMLTAAGRVFLEENPPDEEVLSGAPEPVDGTDPPLEPDDA
jgi:hypothetical protein